MNFPPIVFNDSEFPSLLLSNHPNQYVSTLIESQNILKKLLKFEKKEKNNFQSNVINWLKSCNKEKLIKYFSINSQWFIDILKEMYIIAKYYPDAKFIYNASTKNIQSNLSFFKLFDNKELDNYKPQYSDYFYLVNNDEDGVIDLGKKPEKENIQIKFLDIIRYLTLPKNKNDEKYFFCYNNVVTISIDYLMNLEKFIADLLIITNNEIFKYPIDIETQVNSSGTKYYYNISKAKWLKSKFTLTELLCSYFEQSILVNYEYFSMYNQEISGIYYNKLDEHINNIFKLVEFIGNMEEKKVEIFKSINQDEIYKTFNSKAFIKDIIDYKKAISDAYHIRYNPKFKKLKLFPKKEVISSTLLDLQNLFIKSDLSFVVYMAFAKNTTIFTQDDFVIKIVFDMVNDFWKKKTVEDLLKDYNLDKNKERNNSSNNKKKKKKKKKKNKNKEDIKDEENKNNDNKKNDNEEKKEEINENNNFNSKNKEIQELNKESNINNNEENKIIQTLDDANYSNKGDKESSEENNKEEPKESKEEDDEKKEEKNFFLFPVVKNKKKKNKNKKKDKKHNSSLNNILELNSSSPSKIESTKSNSNINNEISNNKDNQQIINNVSNNKIEKDKNIFNHNNQVYRKPINKFNMNIKRNYEENNNNDKSNGNKGCYHSNKKESNIFRTKENDKYLLAGSNFPGFTSFNFKSKKKKKRKSSEQNQLSFEEKSILEFSKEIMENTQKVNKNKEILQQIREKYIKKTYQNINIFLKNEKVDFLCSFYGSNISGLSIENSDIDIMVKIRKNKDEINYINRIMDVLVNQFKIHQKDELNYIKIIHPIYTASIPVIKVECDLSYDTNIINEQNDLIKNYNLSYNNLTKLLFDITFFEVENELEKIPSELMIDYIKESTTLYPQIIDIIYIMKKFLSIRKLNQSYQGGISSFSLFLLILSFLKFKSKQNNSEEYLGSLLIEFLMFYSDFDFYNSIIRPNEQDPNNIFLLNDIVNNIYKYNIYIVDPITGLNVAKSTFKIEDIKKAFKDGYDIIMGNLYKIKNNENFIDTNNNKTILEHLFFDK